MELGVSRKYGVTVWDKVHEIYVTRTSKSVYVAAGEYMGEMISVKGRTESQARNNWREAAKYKGNL